MNSARWACMRIVALVSWAIIMEMPTELTDIAHQR
jgi:hypothetical protein